MLGLAGAFVADMMDWNKPHVWYNSMMAVDNYSVAFTGLMILITLLWFIMSPSFFKEVSSRTDHFALIIFALVGAQLMTSFSNMLMLFLAIEILSIPMFILAGSNKSELKSNEAALKYFLMGAFATGFLLFGIALIYGVTGSFHLDAIRQYIIVHETTHSVMFYSGLLMMIVGLAFKSSLAPFHFWSPDVYTGSPTVVTAFMSTVVKTAAFAAFLRLFVTCFVSATAMWSTTLWILSAMTIIIGNVTAVYQIDFKRMLAYSSISHAGYMLLAILAMNHMAASSLLYYTAAYSVSSITSFAILLLVSHSTGNDSIASFNGLAKKNPLLAAVTVVAMLSLAGIPPMAGFFAKYYIFSAAIQNHYTGLVVIAVLGSLVGVFYYFRIIIAMFKDEGETVIPVNSTFKALLVFTSLVALVLGIFPGLLTGLL